jgi:arsenite/tail-anchored protein-transporting ATPase
METKMKQFNVAEIKMTKFIFFTGKGGVGKTSTACATAATLADEGYRVLLISTDPASNLQDVFSTDLNGVAKPILGIENLHVTNLDPIEAAAQYRKKVIGPFIGKLPQSVLDNMEEQLSGSCTVEIAAFNEFTRFLADENTHQAYDYIVFDTAPTGHTLRMLQLPTAWDTFIEDSTHGTSCLGQLSGLEDQKDNYKVAVKNLADSTLTTMVLVAKPELSTLIEAQRASLELSDIGINNQILLINGIMSDFDDDISKSFVQKQKITLDQLPEQLKKLRIFEIPLRSYNITGLKNVRRFLTSDEFEQSADDSIEMNLRPLKDIIDYLDSSNRRIIFTMGKGGVGKSSMASAIALGLAARGKKVHLATTDPAGHLDDLIHSNENLEVSHIDEKQELADYQKEILDKARLTMDEDQISYIEEDLRSPCTQEIAVFRAFAEIVEKAKEQVVVIDTAPTGHTLLLLDSTLSYHKEIQRTQSEVPESVKNLLPVLRDPEITEVIIVSLAQTTPVYEALRLQEDLQRAALSVNWWIINSSMAKTHTVNKLLKARANSEWEWIKHVSDHTLGKCAVVEWSHEEIAEKKLLEWTTTVKRGNENENYR